jgi:hypothetical protein
MRVANGGRWLSLPVEVIGHAIDPVDVSVLSLPVLIGADHPLPLTSKDLTIGQDVYLLGFPFGLHTDLPTDLNANFPVAFVKRGVVSAFGKEGGLEVYYLDALNNPGFSGGPVVFRPRPGKDYCVASVIAGYRFDEEPVFRANTETEMQVRANTGIVISWPSHHALSVIEKNPRGLSLSASPAEA